MIGTWGRRVYGTVVKGPKFTRFRLDIVLDNQCTFSETCIRRNVDLERYPHLYSWTLDGMTAKLTRRIAQRAQ